MPDWTEELNSLPEVDRDKIHPPGMCKYCDHMRQNGISHPPGSIPRHVMRMPDDHPLAPDINKLRDFARETMGIPAGVPDAPDIAHTAAVDPLAVERENWRLYRLAYERWLNNDLQGPDDMPARPAFPDPDENEPVSAADGIRNDPDAYENAIDPDLPSIAPFSPLAIEWDPATQTENAVTETIGYDAVIIDVNDPDPQTGTFETDDPDDPDGKMVAFAVDGVIVPIDAPILQRNGAGVQLYDIAWIANLAENYGETLAIRRDQAEHRSRVMRAEFRDRVYQLTGVSIRPVSLRYRLDGINFVMDDRMNVYAAVSCRVCGAETREPLETADDLAAIVTGIGPDREPVEHICLPCERRLAASTRPERI